MTRLVQLFQLLVITLIAIDVRIQCFSHNPTFQRHSLSRLGISVDEEQLASNLEVDDEDEEVEEGLTKKDICVSASIDLPFDAEVAFDAFVDLPRQPSWSSWLRSVTYIDDEEQNKSELKYSSCGIPFRSTKWTIGFRGLKFSWNAQSTTIERPTTIEWMSTSGLKNQGQVLFEENNGTTKMTLSMKFVAPRIVSSLFRRSSRITKFVEEKMLATTLQQFSEVVQEEEDLKKKNKNR